MRRNPEARAEDPSAVHLRPAMRSDADTILRWRNDPWIVSLGKGGRTVSPEEHAAWMARVLADADRHLLFIIHGAGFDIGLVRLDRFEDAKALVTIYLMQPYTGKGYGASALRQAAQAGFATWPALRALEAEVRGDNEPSLRLFAKCGFAREPRSASGQEIVRFRLDRDRYQDEP